VRSFAALLLLLAPITGASAQQRVVSTAPDAVAVTVYRDPERSWDEDMRLDWLGGYALVTETRTIDLPAGTSEIRFEGVADTLVPASVIVRGLPAQPAEKNYDARLISPGALIDAYLGRQVHIRRTHGKTGKVTETEAIIRSGPNGIVLQSPAGIEALRCTGMPETLIYDGVPEGLTDKPTLAIRASAAAPSRATVQLSYLATQLDWQANYLATLNSDGRTLDLFSWLTVANGNEISFAAAQTNAVAGKPNREDDSDEGDSGRAWPSIYLECWPAGTTGYTQTRRKNSAGIVDSIVADEAGTLPEGIVVTASRKRETLMRVPGVAMQAVEEGLGDLKLYRVPEPVTIAANAQKQVALLVKEAVPYARIYSISLNAAGENDRPRSATIRLRLKNEKAGSLGLPLPSGSVAVFEDVDGRPMLAGEPRIDDKAVGEEVELDLGESPDVTYAQKLIGHVGDVTRRDRPRRFEIELSNARSSSVTVEVEFRIFGDYRLARPSRGLGAKNGRHLWRAIVPANERLTLDYTIERIGTNKGKPDPAE
jgi:hypothetical protein